MMYAQYMQAPTKEVRVSKLIQQAHRWLSVIFTATVIANFVAMALGEPRLGWSIRHCRHSS
jgi:hypothetical protein